MGQYFDNEKLPSKMVKTESFVLDNKFIFYTDNGVFSKDGLDFGSRLLLESIPLEEVGGKVLDMGCGYMLILEPFIYVRLILKKIIVKTFVFMRVMFMKMLILSTHLLLPIHQ